MSSSEDLSLQLDLAAAQIITSVLVTLGATLFALSIGIQLTIPQAVKDALNRVVTDQTIIPNIQPDMMQQALDNYVVLMASVGVILIMIGLIYGSAKIRKMRKKIRTAPHLDIDPDET